MAAPAARHSYTVDEYLAFERAARYKSEYVEGQIVAMTGASEEHNLVTLNVGAELREQLRERPCRVYVADMRVKVSVSGLYTYPDVVVVCGEPRFEDAHVDTLLNPTIIVEVLSPSIEAYDRGAKFGYYRELPSLREYLLVAQHKVLVEHYIREDDHWVFTAAGKLEDVVPLPSAGAELPLAEVYHKVDFPVSLPGSLDDQQPSRDSQVD